MNPDDIANVSGVARQAEIELSQTRAACAGLRQAMLERIVITDPNNQRTIDRLVMGVQIIDLVRKTLEKTVAAGQIDNYGNQLAEHFKV